MDGGGRAMQDMGALGGLWPALTAETAKPRSRHAGHRERLRERALKGGLGPLPDYELLELFLFRTFRNGDVKPIAKGLLDRFGSGERGQGGGGDAGSQQGQGLAARGRIRPVVLVHSSLP